MDQMFNIDYIHINIYYIDAFINPIKPSTCLFHLQSTSYYKLMKEVGQSSTALGDELVLQN